MTETEHMDDAQKRLSQGFSMEADVAWLENPMKKEAHIRGFTFISDEPEFMGGENSAPSPLAYFTAAIGF